MISPIVNNGMMARTQDFASLRQMDDNKAQGVQINIQQQIDDKKEMDVHTVHEADDSNEPDTHHDAREEGRNKYFDMRNKNAKKESKADGIVKSKIPSGGFDFKI